MIAFVRKNLTFSILKHTPPVSFSLSLHFFSTSPAILDILQHKYDFPPELASRFASELTHLKNPERVDSILSFLKESGFSNTQLAKIVKYRPRILAASLEDSIKPKIKVFEGVGFSSDDITKIISSNPAILGLSVNNNIIPSFSLMKGLFGSDNDVARILRNSPRFLTVNLKNTVVANVEFLKSCGVAMERIRSIVSNYPSAFLLNPEVTRRSAEKAKEMGINASSNAFIYAIPTIASMSNEAWELKLQAFRELGFSDSDILTMFRKAPRVFYVSVEKIKKIKELLLATGKFTISSIVSTPVSLMFSIDKRYKPRLRILGILESKNLIRKWPSLRQIHALTDAKFSERFIRPYSNEVSSGYILKSSAKCKEEMKP